MRLFSRSASAVNISSISSWLNSSPGITTNKQTAMVRNSSCVWCSVGKKGTKHKKYQSAFSQTSKWCLAFLCHVLCQLLWLQVSFLFFIQNLETVWMYLGFNGQRSLVLMWESCKYQLYLDTLQLLRKWLEGNCSYQINCEWQLTLQLLKLLYRLILEKQQQTNLKGMKKMVLRNGREPNAHTQNSY